MQFSELPCGDRFFCRLPGIRDPVECKKISYKRFQVLGTGEYRTAKPRTMAVIDSHLEKRIDTMITDEPGFNVVCTNPAKSAAIEACWFSYADWTEEDALQQFATDYELELSEVAIEKED